METFSSIDELWHYALRQVHIFGHNVESRNGNSRELIGTSYRLMTTDYTFLADPTRALSPSYAGAETLWYLSGVNNGDMVKAYAPSYISYLSPEGIAHGAYGYRWSSYQQFDRIINELKTQRNSRRAVMTCWRVDDDLGNSTSKDLPCTLTLQFLLRGKQLHLVVNMRSNDMWLGMPYDIFAFTAIQRLIAEALNVDTGTYVHNVGSLHFYDTCREKIDAVVSAGPSGAINTVFRADDGLGVLTRALELEEGARKDTLMRMNQSEFIELCVAELGANTTMLALVLMATSKWMKTWIDGLTKDALSEELRAVLPHSLANVIVARMK